MPSIYDKPITDNDGQFRRKDSTFRDFVSSDPDSKFPAEKDRYVLYANYGCARLERYMLLMNYGKQPWAHRAIITRQLKSLDDVVQLALTDFDLTRKGWLFTGKNGSANRDPLYGFHSLSELYFKADAEFNGRFTVPVLWDKKLETIVNNESSEIIRMFYSEFDALLPSNLREPNRPGGGFYPIHLRPEIDAMNDWVYNTVNNGVYKVGFAANQEAYNDNVYPLFSSLDRLEHHLSQPGHSPYLFGPYITEADIRLYTTMARFDVAYHTIFQCNLKMIRNDYPRLHLWLRNLYWDTSSRTNGGVFHKTTFFSVYKYGYMRAKLRRYYENADEGWDVVLPAGPVPDIYPLSEQERDIVERQFQAALAQPATSPGVVNDHAIHDLASQMQGSGLMARAEFESSHRHHNSNNGTEVGEIASVAGSLQQTTPRESWPADEELEELDAKPLMKRRTTYSDENKKWEKQIKKVAKEQPPAVHLAL